MSKTDAFENDVLRLSTGQAASITYPITPYVALFTVAPTDAGGGTEVSGSSYARQSAAGKFPAPSGGTVSNNATITFPTATGNWGTVVAYGLFTASSGGTMVRWATIAASTAVNTGTTLTFPAGTMTLTET